MNKFLNIVIILGLVLILVIGGWLSWNLFLQEEPTVPTETTSAATTQAAESPAPDFTFYDKDGNAYKLSDFRGKPVILNFWASWCGPCKAEMPDFNEAYAVYGDRIHFIMLNLTDGYSETVETATAFLATTDYTFPVYFDTDSAGAITYGISSIPVTWLIDAEGNLIARASAALDADTLQKGIDMILN